MKPLLFAVYVLIVSLFSVPASAAELKTGAFPSTENPSFLVSYPADWELTPAEAEEGAYATLMGPSGAYVMVRTIAGDKETLTNAVEGAQAYVEESYKEVKLEETKLGGTEENPSFFRAGTAIDSDGAAVVFLMGWFALKDDTIGELWFTSFKDDKEGALSAAKIMDSVRLP